MSSAYKMQKANDMLTHGQLKMIPPVLNMSLNNSFASNKTQISSTCSAVNAHVTFNIATLVLGLLANSQLCFFSVKQLKAGKTPDKVLILSLATVDVVALIICVPMHTNVLILESKTSISQQFIDICHWEFSLLLILFFYNLLTLATIAVDRFEALTRFAHQRKFRTKTAIYATGVIGIIAIVIGKLTSREKATTVPFCSYALSGTFAVVYKDLIARVAVITVVVNILCTVISRCLIRAARYIRKHRSEMEAMFGPREKQRKIDFTKTCIAFSCAYIMTWAPFGITATIYTFSQTKLAFCAYQWAHSVSFVCFLIIPLIYMISDKRVVTFTLRIFSCNAVGANRNIPRGNNVLNHADKLRRKSGGDRNNTATTKNCNETILKGRLFIRQDTEGTPKEVTAKMQSNANESVPHIHKERNLEASLRGHEIQEEAERFEKPKEGEDGQYSHSAFNDDMLESLSDKMIELAPAPQPPLHRSCNTKFVRETKPSSDVETNEENCALNDKTTKTEKENPTQSGRQRNEEKSGADLEKKDLGKLSDETINALVVETLAEVEVQMQLEDIEANVDMIIACNKETITTKL